MEYERRLGEEYFNEALNSILKVLNASNTETADNGITNSDNQYMNYIDREVNDIINEYNLPNTEEIRKLVAMIIEEEIQKSIRDRLHSYIEKLTPEEMNVLILFHKPDYVKETYDEKLVCVMKERIPSELAYELQKKDLIDEYDIEGKRYYCIRWY
jgi:GTP-binding protein EngB required for normal cell division